MTSTTPITPRRAESEILFETWDEIRNWPRQLLPRQVHLRPSGLHLEYRTKEGKRADYVLTITNGETRLTLLNSDFPPRLINALGTNLIAHVQRLPRQTLKALQSCIRIVQWLNEPHETGERMPGWAKDVALFLRRERAGELDEGISKSGTFLLSRISAILKARDFGAAYAFWQENRALLERGAKPSEQLAFAIISAVIGQGRSTFKALTHDEAFSHDRRLAWIAGRLAMTHENWPLAYAHLRHAIDFTHPGKLREFTTVAEAAEAYSAAIKSAEQALILVKDSEVWWPELIDILIHSGAPDVASRFMTEFLSGDRACDLTRAKAAQVELILGRPTSSMDIAAQIHAPENQWMKSRAMGMAESTLTNYSMAAEHFKAALNDQPEDQETVIWLSEVYLRMNKKADALDLMTRFDKRIVGQHPVGKLLSGLLNLEKVRINDTSYVSMSISGDILGHLDQDTILEPLELRSRIWQAIDALSPYRGPRLLQQGPGSGQHQPVPEVQDPRARVIVTQHRVLFESVDQVAGRLEELTRTFPSVPYYRTYAAELYLWKGDYQRALASFSKEWEMNQTRWSYVGAGTCEALLGNDSEALEWWKRGESHFYSLIPGEVTHSMRGEVQRKHGELEEALKNLEYAVKVVPTRVSAWLELTLIYFDLGREEDALTAVEPFLRLSPTLVWESHRALGLKPTLRPKRADLYRILEKSKEMMAGNRSSHLLSFYDADGQWRIHTISQYEKHWTRLGDHITASAIRVNLTELFSEHFELIRSGP